MMWCSLYSIFNPQPWDSNVQIMKPILIVLLKTKLMNNCTSIAIE